MSDETALVPIKVEPPKAILPTREELNVIGLIAKSVMGARGHAVPQQIDSPAKAAAVMLAGHELGLKPMTALRHIYVVNGKTEPSAQVMAGVVQAREPDARIDVVELNEERCTVRLVRPSRDINVEYTYEYADAERAGLTKPSRSGQPSNWVLYPKDMMRWAAVKRICRTYASDLINSIGAVEVEVAEGLIEGVSQGAPSTYIEASATVPQEALYNEGDEAPTAGSEELQGAEDAPAPSVDIADGDFTETDEDEAPPAPDTPAQPESTPRKVPAWATELQDALKGAGVELADLECVLGRKPTVHVLTEWAMANQDKTWADLAQEAAAELAARREATDPFAAVEA